MPTKKELEAELAALKAAQSGDTHEDPRIAQAVALGIPREVAVAQFTGDNVAPEPKVEDRPTFHASFLRNGKVDRVMYIDDGKYIASGTMTAEKVSRVKRFPIGLLAALDDAGWKALRSAADRAAACDGTYTYDLGDVFTK
jgi:hypothetical protein